MGSFSRAPGAPRSRKSCLKGSKASRKSDRKGSRISNKPMGSRSGTSQKGSKASRSVAQPKAREACKTPPAADGVVADNTSRVDEFSNLPTLTTPGSVGSAESDGMSDSEIGSLAHGQAEDLDLVLPRGEGESKSSFVKKQAEDDSLKHQWALAKDKLRGYDVRDQMLVHVISGELGEECVRLVVPRCECEKLLVLAHDKGGHLGVKKVRSKLNKLFTWPGLAGDVLNHVSSCHACAQHNKAGNRLPQLQERPVVGEPFRSVAIDLVGPLPKGRGGATFLLTYTCASASEDSQKGLRYVI